MKRHRHNSLLMLLLATTVLALTSDDSGKVDLPLNSEVASAPEAGGGSVSLINAGNGNPAIKTEGASAAKSVVLEDTVDGDKMAYPVSSGLNIPNFNVPPAGEVGSPDGQASAKVDDGEQKEKLFFWAQSSTTTKFMISVFSSTTPYTCALLRSQKPCTGRRRRFLRHSRPINVEGDGLINGFLESSSSDDNAMNTADTERSNAKGFLTVWTTSFSTKTVTSWFTNTRVTVSISQACSVPGPLLAGCG